MKIFNRMGLLTLLFIGFCIQAAAQNSSLHVANGTSLFIKSGTPVYADGLVLTPDADYSLAGVTTLIRSAAVIQPNPGNIIQRVYHFTTPATAFSGSIGIRFIDSELNGLQESNLVLNIYDGATWTTYSNVSRDAANNLVTANNLSNVTISEVTLSSATVVPVLSLNPASFCSADNNSYLLTATPAGGEWTGNGVVDNNDGSWSFRPSLAGVGNHQLLYTLPSESGSATLNANVAASPNKFNVTGGGAFCPGEAGLPIGLQASEPGVTYQLYLNGLPVAMLPGNGGPLNFGSRTTAGSYTITGSANGCATTMNGAAVVVISEAATATVIANGPTNFCPSGSVTFTANEGSSYLWSNGATTRSITVSNAGSYSVTVTNAAGCDATSTAVSVTVSDNEAPQISFCPAPGGDAATIVRGSVSCGYGIKGSEFNVSAMDNCNASLTYSYVLSGATSTKMPITATSLDGVELGLGVTTITWTVRDASGNSSSCSFAVEVKDLTQPTLHVPSDITLECTGSVPDNSAMGMATAFDNCDTDVSISYSDESSLDPQGNSLGMIRRTWTATDNYGNQSTGIQLIHIVDTTPPLPISLPDITGECAVTVTTAPVAVDVCNGTVSGTTTDPLTYNSQGTHFITWTFVDQSGNRTTQVQKIVIDDRTAPVLQGYVPNNLAVDCHAVPSAPNVIAVDNCDATPIVTLQESTTKKTDPYAREFYNYTITRTWTATDNAGNQAVIAQQVVTVTDRYGPTISLTPRLTRYADDKRCGVQILNLTAKGADACSPVTVTNNITGTNNAAGFYPVGTTNIVWTVTDVSGNVSQAITILTVLDNQLPQVTAPTDISVSADNGSCTASGVNLGTPLATDNCGIMSISNNAPDIFGLGTTEILWTVVDPSGNTTIVTQKVIVNDTERPSITAPADINGKSDDGSCHATGVILGMPTTSDNCTVEKVTNDAPALFPVGITLVIWTVTDASGNTATASQKVMITDQEKPLITAPAAINAGNDAGKCSASGITLGLPVTSDNCSVAKVSNDAPAAFPVGTTLVTWTVEDAAGNTATATQSVTVRDEEKPTIKAPAEVVIYTVPGTCSAPAMIQLGEPVTSDNCGVATVGFEDADGGKVSIALGENIITWTVYDQAGNAATAIQKVTLVDAEKPLITAPANITVANDPGNCSAVVSVGAAVASDNCTLASVTNDAPAVFPVGTTIVTWTATDASGNTNTATQTVIVTDNEKPAVSCPSLPASYCFNSGGYSIPKLTAADNCGIKSVLYTVTGSTVRSGSGYDAGTAFNTGTSVITWTVTDLHGNQSTCQANVVVIDPMVVTIPDAKALPAGVAPNTVYIGYSPAATVTLTANAAGGSGNYSFLWSTGETTQSITVSPYDFTTYTVTVTDDKGCSKTATKQVNVVDVRCGNNLDKVLVCHVPDGNASNAHNVCVSVSAVANLLAEGDYLGVCGGLITPPVVTADVKTLVEFTIAAMPNPSATYFTLKLSSTSDLPIKLRVTDLYGRVLETRDNITPGSSIELGSRYKAGAYFVEVIQGLEWRHVKLIKTGN